MFQTTRTPYHAYRLPLLAFLFLSCDGLGVAIARDGNLVILYEEVSFKSCEFIATFPTKTRRALTKDGALAVEMVISVKPENHAVFRAECQPLSDRAVMLNALRDTLQRYVTVLGLRDSEASIKNGKLGVIGTFSGVKTDQGYTLRYHGQYTVGRSSAMFQMVVEPAESYPSAKTSFFLNSVKKR